MFYYLHLGHYAYVDSVQSSLPCHCQNTGFHHHESLVDLVDAGCGQTKKQTDPAANYNAYC